MKKIAIFSIVMACFAIAADGAVTGTQRRGQAVVTDTAAAVTSATSARAARVPATRTGTSATAPTTTSARSATNVASRTNTPPTTAARAAATPTVAARAGATQKVVSTGTTVAAAQQNTVVNQACREKYEGCMDSFCMLDNTSGGRCLCSDRNAELNDVLAEIEKLDAQSYKMATEGVEKIEMGSDAAATIAAANAVANEITNPKTNSRRTLDLSLWDAVEFEPVEDIFAITTANSIDNKTGDALHKAVSDLCVAQMPECSNDIAMLKLMYSQQIKSDCSAYENNLKQQKNTAANRLASAEKALREAALEQYRTANKYDLGQCTVQFKNCMATTAGCKDDFTGCVGIAAAENARASVSAKASMKMVSISGANTKIQVAASTLDALESKKPMCMNVTNNCVAVAGQVWDTFLREVAPQLKTAELLAESDLRTNCISNISSCFQKACRDTIDPNDPDGSYDLCLSRPETVRSLCKVQIDPCVSAEPLILDYVYAKLAAMRVDSCTDQVKACLTSEDRCGSDYTQCVGLSTDTIIRMCPYDKLTGCQKVYSDGSQDIRGTAVYDEIANMVQGIMLNIDNNMLTQCQNAADAAMIKVCGGLDDCNGLATDDYIGGQSLEYKICEYTGSGTSTSINYSKCRTDISQVSDAELRDGIAIAGVLDGMIYWGSIDFDDNGILISADDYIAAVDTNMTSVEKEKIKAELAGLQKNINNVISAVESDSAVQYCMTGRQVQGINNTMFGGGAASARFPGLTQQMRLTIATSALKIARDNYQSKYDELTKKMTTDYATVAERATAIAQEDALNVRREIARKACVSMADFSVLPMSPSPPKAWGILGGALLEGIRTPNASSLFIPFAGGKKIGDVEDANTPTMPKSEDLIGSSQLNQWNYKETVTSTFNWENLVCTKCVRAQKCSKTKNPMFGSKYCKTWGDAEETCEETQF